jgi:O-antigen/teichoic acid export membrane protein
LGAREFGVYFLIGSFSVFAYVLVDWGQQYYVIREVARLPERSSLLLGTILVLRVVAAALVAIASSLAVWALGYDEIIRWYSVAFIAVSLPFFLAQSYGLIFRGHDRMDLDAGVSVANKSTLVGLALAVLALGAGLPGVLVAHAVAGFFGLGLAFWLYRRVLSGPVRYSPQIAREVLTGGGAFLTMVLAVNIQPYMDVVILSKLVPVDIVGWYGAAKTIIGTIFAPALILGAASFPSLVRAAANKRAFKTELRAALRPLQWLGALAAIGTFLFADDAIGVVYGQKHFGPSGMILKVYAPAFFLLFINFPLSYALSALDRAMALSVLKVASVALSTALELVLIPIFQQHSGNGGMGVAAAFVASEVVVLGGAIFLLRDCLALDFAADVARALASASVTLLLFWWMPPLPLLVSVPMCIIVYLLCSVGLGLVRRADVELLRALLRKERSAPSNQSFSTRSPNREFLASGIRKRESEGVTLWSRL